MGCIMGKNQVHIIGDSTGKPVRNASVETLDRGGSATSKASRHSGDSGFNDEAEAAMLNEQLAIQKDILSRQPLSAGGKKVERVEEKKILDTLHEEGLIQKPIGSTAHGMSFEVLNEMTGDHPRRLPPRLAKLETKKKKRKPLTEEQIRQKLERAEQRRKDHENERIKKLHRNTEPQGAAENAAKEAGEPAAKTKEEIAADNREAKLRERLEKIRLKREHAEEVRRKKKLLAEAAVASGENPAFDAGENPPEDAGEYPFGKSKNHGLSQVD